MSRRRATLILIAILALVDLVGAALLHDAWRHNKAASVATPATGAKTAASPPVGEASAVHAGI